MWIGVYFEEDLNLLHLCYCLFVGQTPSHIARHDAHCYIGICPISLSAPNVEGQSLEVDLCIGPPALLLLSLWRKHAMKEVEAQHDLEVWLSRIKSRSSIQCVHSWTHVFAGKLTSEITGPLPSRIKSWQCIFLQSSESLMLRLSFANEILLYLTENWGD